MDQDKAVQMMMLEIKIVIGEDSIPKIYDKNGKEVDIFLFISCFFKKYLHLMYVVGYDEGNRYLKNPRTSPVIRTDEFGNEKRFESIIEAAHQTKCNPVTISKAIMYNVKRVGYSWKRATS
jgi:hypothetical protein